MTDINEVYRWVNHYKNLLGLQHWEIKIKLLSPAEVLEHLDDSGTFQGQIHVHNHLLAADIELVDPKQLSHDQCVKIGVSSELRSTLLHEMIHVLLESCNIPDDRTVEYEQAVIRLERAIRYLEEKLLSGE